MSADLASKPPGRAVETLQELALIGVAKWLEAPYDGREPDAEDLSDIAIFHMTAKHDVTRWQKQTLKRFSGRFQVTEPPNWSLTQSLWLADAKILPGWERLMRGARERFAILLGRGAHLFAPFAPCLLEAVETQSWTAPVFRRSVARLFRTHLRGRVILSPGPTPVPVLAAPTLWAAATVTLDRLPAAQMSAERRMQVQFRTLTAQKFAKHGWAGFWDGYVLGRAKALGADVPGPNLTPDLAGTTIPHRHFRNNWRKEAPGFAPRLLANTL